MSGTSNGGKRASVDLEKTASLLAAVRGAGSLGRRLAHATRMFVPRYISYQSKVGVASQSPPEGCLSFFAFISSYDPA